MFELIDYKPEHAMEVVQNGVLQPNLKFCDKVQPWAVELAEHPSKTVIFNGRIVGCGGIVILYPKHRAEAWALAVEDVAKLRIDHRKIRCQLYDWIIEYELKRIEAPLRADFEAGISYAQHMGFEYETTLKYYHPDGVDAKMHVIIRDIEGEA